jgi:hypothetical protein
MKIKVIYNLLLTSVLWVVLGACSKDAAKAELNTSYRLLLDKTWYLEYTVTNYGQADSTHSYIGQATYFISYRKNLSTLDSDGIEGSYALQLSTDQLLMNVTAKTANLNATNYQYEVLSLGEKDMILSYKKGNIRTKLFFSTERKIVNPTSK